jgi:uncharacterized protein
MPVQFQQVKAFILDKLEKELPTYLSYHNVGHVLDVYLAAENIGHLEKLSKQDLQLLLTAALFHDAGFVVDASDHEERSCSMAGEYLPAYGYEADDVEKIRGMIMATKIPQQPKTHLEEIMSDADLDYLGRDDFFGISNSLYLELKHNGIVDNENDWNKIQVKFFENHHYFTKTAIRLRQEKKAAHLEAINAKTK